MTKVANPPPKPQAVPLPVMGNGTAEDCFGCFVIGLGIAALSGAAVGFIWGVFVGLAAR
jgi:hypothetical protein